MTKYKVEYIPRISFEEAYGRKDMNAIFAKIIGTQKDIAEIKNCNNIFKSLGCYFCDSTHAIIIKHASAEFIIYDRCITGCENTLIV